MHCRHCGQQIEADSKFCRFCGGDQSPPQPQTPSPPLAPALGASAPTSSIAPRVFAVGAVLLIILIALGSRNNSSTPSKTASEIAADNTATYLENQAKILEAQANAPPVPPPSSWSYSTDEDNVRGATTYFARNTSKNTIDQGFPYGHASLGMMVRKSPAYGTDVIFTLSSGQLLCRSYDGCYATVRFDEGKPRRISLSESSDNSSDTVFVNGAKTFIASLRGAKRAIVELEIYQQGRPQFEFDVSGLEWKH